MRIVLAYVCVTGGPITADFAARFVGTYLAHPPGIEHDTVIIGNGGPLPLETGLLFAPMQHVFLPRANDDSWDIGAYQQVAAQEACDLLVCCGESIYFHRPGWLRRLAEARLKFGPGMYGMFSSNLVRPHLNTTGFAVDPKFLLGRAVPRSKAERYEFEHGQRSFWRQIHALGQPVRLVTWDGEYGPMQWRRPPNILWRGTQENCLAFCSHTDRYRDSNAKDRKGWERAIDAPFA